MNLFNRYTVVALWITSIGMSTQVIKVFTKRAALKTAQSIRNHGEGYATVCVIGPNGGTV